MAQIALTLYTLRDHMAEASQIPETLRRVREIGYRHVQVSGVRGASGNELRRMLDGAGLECMATHCRYDQLTSEAVGSVADEMAALGCRHTALAWLPQELHNRAGFVEAGQRLRGACESLAERGMTLSYHNHAFEFERFDGVTGWELMFAEAPGLCAEFDVYWLNHAGCDPASWVMRCDRPQPLIHLKDKEVAANVPRFAEVGHGNLEWPGILAAAEAKGVEWWIVEQDDCWRDPFESIRMSFDFLSRARSPIG